MKEIKIKYKNGCISYFLMRKKNIKNINLRIKEDLNIYVSAPYWIKTDLINNFVLEKTAWIEEAKKNISGRNKLKAQKLEKDKNIFYYLGKKYEIRFVEGSKKSVVLENNYAVVLAEDITVIPKALDKFTRESGLNLIYCMLDDMEHILSYVGLKKRPEIKLRKMKARWGSCHYGADKIILNTELFKKPKECVYYVLLHELCHFREPNHSRDFYYILGRLMPDWKEIKKILNEAFE